MYKLLQSQEFMRNPAPVLAQLRAQGPLIRGRVPIIGDVWFTTTQSAAARILKDDHAFTVRRQDGRVAGLSWWMPSLLKRLTSNMLSSDEPEHRRLRGIVDHAFQRRAVAGLADTIDTLAESQQKKLFENDDPADLIAEFSRPFPLWVICELLGLPEEDRHDFSKWAGNITSVTGILSFLFVIFRLRPLTRYIEQRIRHGRLHGSEGLVHELVVQNELDEDELVAMIFLLLLAGHETTTHLISGSLYALFSNTDQLDKLRQAPDGLDIAIEELMRFVSPVQTTKPRIVRDDCDIDGVQLKHGDMVMPLLVAANFDPEVFENPEQLNLSRRPNRHMVFGSGIHFCLGHQLARMEMKSALSHLVLGDNPVRPAIALDDL
ncbi:MAG: cytochrome P450, partial [Pseudomonadota bacterium]